MIAVYNEDSALPYDPKLDQSLPEGNQAAEDAEARSWWEAGLKHFENGELEEAAECFGRVLCYDPENRPALKNLGVVYFGLHRYREAKEFFGRHLHLLKGPKAVAPALADAHLGIGSALLGLWGQPETKESELALHSDGRLRRVFQGIRV
jgi:tetratricopeptide (TPR) repeat protein